MRKSKKLENMYKQFIHVKFIYSEKATRFCETYLVKSTVEISQNFVAMNKNMK